MRWGMSKAFGLFYETWVGKIQQREQKLMNKLKIMKFFLEGFKNDEAGSKEGTQILIHRTKFIQINTYYWT